MRTIHLIHGFNETHPIQKPSIACLKPMLCHRGFKVMIHDYGKLNLVETTANNNLARLIYPHVADGDTLIGFSNGAAIVAHLQSMGARTPKIILIQPALSNTWRPNSSCMSVSVLWNPHDLATLAGKWYRRFTGLMPWRWQDKHHWGEMGHTGYVGGDMRYLQYQTDATEDMPVVAGHSDWALPKNRDWWELIANNA